VTDYTVIVTKLTEFERRIRLKELIITIAYKVKELEAFKDIRDLKDSGDEEPLIRCYKCRGIKHKRSECLIKKLV
jgi:hypothetical protein